MLTDDQDHACVWHDCWRDQVQALDESRGCLRWLIPITWDDSIPLARATDQISRPRCLELHGDRERLICG
jgi:hypothetical protein